ncbi:MAG: hypothetical protein M3040_10910, partial [Bacteroidota bacterium]|nr:hypothetical protein [Bacteroidota bacterium]
CSFLRCFRIIKRPNRPVKSDLFCLLLKYKRILYQLLHPATTATPAQFLDSKPAAQQAGLLSWHYFFFRAKKVVMRNTKNILLYAENTMP